MISNNALAQKRKVAFSVEQHLLNQIRTGGLKPGDALPSERALMRDWGVGRPAIREAMQSLERKGLIQIRHGERAKLVKPSFDRLVNAICDGMHYVLAYVPDAVRHMREARRDFEVAMVRKAAISRTEHDLAAMRRHLQAQWDNLHDRQAFSKASHNFHATVVAAAGNPVLVAADKAMMAWLLDFGASQIQARPVLESDTRGHQTIYEAIESGDPDRAEKAMAEHHHCVCEALALVPSHGEGWSSQQGKVSNL